MRNTLRLQEGSQHSWRVGGLLLCGLLAVCTSGFVALTTGAQQGFTIAPKPFLVDLHELTSLDLPGWYTEPGPGAIAKLYTTGIRPGHEAATLAVDQVSHRISIGAVLNDLGYIGEKARGVFDVALPGDIWLTYGGQSSGKQSLYVPGHIYMVPSSFSEGAGDTVYLQARRSDSSGTTNLRVRTYDDGHMTDAMAIMAGGDVGIGTTDPQSRLDLRGPGLKEGEGTAGGVLRILDSHDSEMVLDGNNIECIGKPLALNARTDSNIHLALGGGFVGIGTASPESRLDLRGPGLKEGEGTAGGVLRILDSHDSEMVLDGNNIECIGKPLALNARTDSNIHLALGGGFVGIGTASPDNELDVCGTIRAKEVVVETGWSDFVFAPGYSLMPLQDVAQYIGDNGHLPGVPAEATIESEGVPLGQSQAVLLQKIEELTLYIIEQDRRIGELERRVASMTP